ncbi:MAG: hypothetical protein FWG39_00785 [Alphaproteobacteria bacterium]|nr:hypothetical protein [Alphaproteobacteria bacterium]
MTREEFISELENRGATLLPKAGDHAVELARNSLQQMRAAIIPAALSDIYKDIAGGFICGDAHILGPENIARAGRNYEMPGIVQINRDISGLPGASGKTVFGRNQMFWFAFDAFGNFYMLNVLNLNVLREYKEDAYRAILDCLAVGKI